MQNISIKIIVVQSEMLMEVTPDDLAYQALRLTEYKVECWLQEIVKQRP